MRSKFEQTVYLEAAQKGINIAYEPGTIPYIIAHDYLPDFIIPPPPKLKSGKYNMNYVLTNHEKYIIIEVKGKWDYEDRRKHNALREQYPNLDVRFVFQRPTNKATKKRTYGEYCDWKGIKWSKSTIPQAWIEEAKRLSK